MNSLKETEWFGMLHINTNMNVYLHAVLLNVVWWLILEEYTPEYTDSEQSCHESSIFPGMIREKVHQMELNGFVDE